MKRSGAHLHVAQEREREREDGFYYKMRRRSIREEIKVVSDLNKVQKALCLV